ncbi:sporulation protein YqfD [Maledivibacter halophilus]|uniref:Similar to stage IV sporulation protein n=1 Tax=Maledivibacter halophilus TaxID=36842 RepID=A0A1T5LUL3_9FIRM|nr:sporulation protein YqfD [Maledivibacter halophilus]SKC79591.1 similar to stage IV sporulation protein [Maledivibacter halophilus]
MLIIKILNFFRGYVVFKLEGLNLEKILNLAANQDIYLWDIRRINYTTIEGKTRAKGYKQLCKILKKTGCRGKIQLKVGYPFLIFRLKRKKIVAVGFIICLLLIIGITSFIWDIEIKGNINISKKDMLTTLGKSGVKTGVFKYSLNKTDIKNNLLINYEDLAWVGVEVEGTKIKIEVVEKEKDPNIINEETPCHIVAKKNGIVERIIARNGDAMVKKGDIVRQNQILISGKIEREEGILRLVHSSGEVYARTFYEKTKELPICEVTKVKTGRKHTKRIFKFGESSFTISKDEIPFDKYVIRARNKSLAKWRKIEIPVEFVIEEYFEIIEKKRKVPEDILKKSIKDFLMVNLTKEIPEDAQIVKQTIDYRKNGSNLWGRLTIEVIESIGTRQRFEIQEEE